MAQVWTCSMKTHIFIWQVKIILKCIVHAYYKDTEENFKVPTENINNGGQRLHP